MTGPTGPLIVLVDDDLDFTRALTDCLPPCQLRTFCSAPPALRFLRQSDPALILLDYDLPGWNGLELLQRIRCYLHLRQRPALLLTAHQSRELLYEGFEAGLDDFLYKPVDKKEVRLRIERLLARRSTLLEQLRGLEGSTEGARILALRLDRRALNIPGFDSFLRLALLLLGGRSQNSRARLVEDILLVISSPVREKQLLRILKWLKRSYNGLSLETAFRKTEEHFVEESPLRGLRLLAVDNARAVDYEFLRAIFAETDQEFLVYRA